MKNLLLATIILLGLFVSCSPYPNKTYKLYTKEYTAFTHNAAVDSIEKKYNVRLNSLEKIERFGGELHESLWYKYDSIRQSLTEAEWFDRETELDIELAKVDSMLLP